MAEWIGHLLAAWPTWAIGFAVVFIVIVLVLYYVAFAADNFGPPAIKSKRRYLGEKKNAKK